MNNLQVPIARQEGLVIQEADREVLVYDVDTHKAHCLNQTAAFIWQSCDGKSSVDEIKVKLERAFGKNVDEDLIWLAIDQLGEKKLLQNSPSQRFSGQTRRDVLKKIGFATVIALPIVTSLVAPPSVLAVISCGGTCGAGSTVPCSDACPFCNTQNICSSTNNRNEYSIERN